MPESPQQHIERIRWDKFGWKADGSKAPNSLEQDLRHALKHLAEELYSQKHHFILELIQNAEDNKYRDGDTPMLSLQLLPDDPTGTPDAEGCLLLLNNEEGFQPEHVESLCSSLPSKKKKAEGYIGEKGIGFKSVFQVTARPHIFSNGYQFCFRHPEGDHDLGYIVPHWVEIPEILRDNNVRTAILLPLLPGQRESLAAELLAIAPETILFLAKLSALRIDTGAAKRTVIRDGRDGLVTLHAGDSETRYFVVRASCPRSKDLAEEKRAGIERRELTIAFPLDAANDCTGRIFAFLPTRCDSGFPFLVNADFLLTANRESILDGRPWNQWLRNCIAPAFVLAFKALLKQEDQRSGAYRFIPLQSDLRQQTSEFFRSVVDAIHKSLRDDECVWTEGGGFVQPGRAWFAGKAERALLQTADAPPRLTAFRFVAPELEQWHQRLDPLRVQRFSPANFLEVINDQSWLQKRDEDWWESALQFLAESKVDAAAVAQIPLLHCADGVCRKPMPSEVFLNGESPIRLPEVGPDVHLFAARLQRRLQQKPLVWAWLTQTLRLSPLSPRAYIVNRLLPWMRAQSGEGAGARLVAVTRFIFANSASLDDTAKASVKGAIPWLLADGRIAMAEARASKEVVTPEALEGVAGWHWLFIGPADREHFLILANDYVGGATDVEKEAWRKFLDDCGVTAIPDPAKRELAVGQPLYVETLARCANEVSSRSQLRDWAAPRWLRDLVSVETLPNSAAKLGALARWLGAFAQNGVAKFFRLSKRDHAWVGWEELRSWSELGFALRTKPWLKTTRGYCAPPQAFIQTQELQDFLGDSAPYAQTTVSVELLEKLGVRARLTADVLLDLLRQMRDAGHVNFDLITRIYRRLHDSQFDTSAFRTEALIYLGEGTPWRKLGELVWKDTGPVFDEHFGYLEPVYRDHDLKGFFTQKLQVPEEPDLRQFAEVWAKLSQENAVDRESVEKRLKLVIEKLVTAQETLANESWWPEVRLRLKVWTGKGGFMEAQRVYAPDDGFAVEVFGHAPIAWNPVQAHRFAPFLKTLGCRSLAGAMHATLRNGSSELVCSANQVLTSASQELIVCLVCNDKSLKWRERQSFLEAILATKELFAPTVEVDYSLADNPDVAPVPRLNEAFWHANAKRLVLKEGAELDAWRSATADSIAAALAGITQRRELTDTIYRLLTASADTAERIRREKNWSLTQDQDDWLAATGCSRSILERREREAEPVRARSPRLPEPGGAKATPQPQVPSKEPPSQPAAESRAAPPVAGQPSESTPQANPEVAGVPPNSDLPEQQPRQQQEADSAPSTAQTPSSGNSTPISERAAPAREPSRVRLKHSDSERPELRRAQPRQSQQRKKRAAAEPHEQDGNSGREERRTGLESLSQDEKAELEQLGRKRVTAELIALGYRVKPMGERSPGYDLHAEKGNEVLKVEVKAHLRAVSKVFVPKGEWREYLHTKNKTDSRWELWNVEFLAEDSGHRVRITRYSEIPTDALEENGFWVDLNRCS